MPAAAERASAHCALELADATKKLALWKPLSFHENPQIKPTLVKLIDEAEVSLRVTQCYLSDGELTAAMMRAMRDRAVKVGLVIDYSQTKTPASRFMPDQLRVLSEWGADIRTFQPHGGVTSLMHAKS